MLEQKYEVYFILNPELNQEKIDSLISDLEAFVTAEIGGKNLQTNIEGLKKLAYPIKKAKTGFYFDLSFDLSLENLPKVNKLNRKLNLNENIYRYLLLNQTDFYKAKSKEKLNKTEIVNHRDLNKGKKKKSCIVKHLGYKDIDFRDTEFLTQFVSPYSKIFARHRTGTSAKYQRKVTTAIKRARHMALMSFTPQYK